MSDWFGYYKCWLVIQRERIWRLVDHMTEELRNTISAHNLEESQQSVPRTYIPYDNCKNKVPGLCEKQCWD